MQNNTKYFIGIDVSKPFFDAALMAVVNHQKQVIESAHFDNTELGLKAFEKWLKKHKVSFDENTVLVIENTGIYRCGEPSPLALGILQ
jgi:transposase